LSTEPCCCDCLARYGPGFLGLLLELGRGLLLDVLGRLGRLARGAEGRDTLGREVVRGVDRTGALRLGAEGRRTELLREGADGLLTELERVGADGRLTELLRVGCLRCSVGRPVLRGAGVDLTVDLEDGDTWRLVGVRRAVAVLRLVVLLVGLACERLVVRLVGVTLRAVVGWPARRVVVAGRARCVVGLVVRRAVVFRVLVLVPTVGMVRRPLVVTPRVVGDLPDVAANLRPAADVGT
jgi:hypothetical protein